MQERAIKGIATELLCQTEFIKLGIDVSVPINPYCKYDFIVDINNILYRIQVKYSHKCNNGIKLSTSSSHLTTNGATKTKYTKKDIDFICTYFDETCYLIPIIEIENRSSITLLFQEKRKNGCDMMFAKNYILQTQIDNLLYPNTNIGKKQTYKIQQCDLNGNIIKEYNSVAETDICKQDISKQSHISDCINGNRKTAYGYIWKRIEYYI